MFRYPTYWILRGLARAAAWIYFGRLILRGRDRIPSTGPVILAANHPQSIVDAVILSICSRRTVHYLAHAGLFKSWPRRMLLRACGVIPVYRQEDRTEAGERNDDAFAACRAVLEAGGCLGIFPEGTSLEERRVQPLKTGTARIALEAESANDFSLGVQIVPVGLSFESRRRFRSHVLATLGEALSIAEFADAYAQHSAAAVAELTELLHDRICGLVVDIDEAELEGLVEGVERIYKDELLRSNLRDFDAKDPFDREHFVSKEIAKAAQYFHENDPQALKRVGGLMEVYEAKLERLKLDDHIVREADQGFRDRATRLLAVIALASPVALFGFLWNVLPYQLTRSLVRRLAPDGTKTHFHQLTQGGWVFLVFYGLYWYALESVFGPWRTLLLLTTFALSGFFSLRFATAVQTGRKHLRFLYLRATHRVMIQRLVSLRRTILREMELARRIYQQAREARE